MRLADLLSFKYITIQCHDNPDADTIASGYAIYKYYESKGKNVRLIYSGPNMITKANLKLLIETFKIPLEYIEKGTKTEDEWRKGLWITADCQYGAGNVTHFDADNVAIIDHHQIEIDDMPLNTIIPGMGSCSTIVYGMLKEAEFEVNDDEGIGTALYYGLYTDTNQLSEMSNPVDRDMADQISHDAALINTLKNTNISLCELEIAGVAMLRYSFNEDYGFAVVKSQPCDPNILGLISDFLLQVDKITTCVVFCQNGDGFKLSIRSCVKEVNASELAAFLTERIGSGGGHYEKAGGFISEKLFRKSFDSISPEIYLSNRLKEYYEMFELIYAADYNIDINIMETYVKKKLPIGYVRAKDMLPIGTPITVRSLEGDMDLTVDKDLVIMIGVKGEVYPNRLEKFKKSNQPLEEAYDYDKFVLESSYIPTIKNRLTGQNELITRYASVCVPKGEVKIFACPLDRYVKVFTAWDKEKYMLGKPGDYLAVRCDDLHDIYVIEKNIFGLTYEEA